MDIVEWFPKFWRRYGEAIDSIKQGEVVVALSREEASYDVGQA